MLYRLSPIILLGTRTSVKIFLPQTKGNNNNINSGRSNSKSFGKGKNGFVPHDKWKKMTDKEKAAHRANYSKSKASKQNREVQAATTEVDEENASNTETNAGSQFGSNAYANKRQKAS